MRYTFTEEGFDEGCALWKASVPEKAAAAPGMARIQFLEARPVALAVGSWRDKADAEAFMRTGVFRDLLERLGPLLARKPEPEAWDLAAYAEGKA